MWSTSTPANIPPLCGYNKAEDSDHIPDQRKECYGPLTWSISGPNTPCLWIWTLRELVFRLTCRVIVSCLCCVVVRCLFHVWVFSVSCFAGWWNGAFRCCARCDSGYLDEYPKGPKYQKMEYIWLLFLGTVISLGVYAFCFWVLGPVGFDHAQPRPGYDALLVVDQQPVPYFNTLPDMISGGTSCWALVSRVALAIGITSNFDYPSAPRV